MNVRRLPRVINSRPLCFMGLLFLIGVFAARVFFYIPAFAYILPIVSLISCIVLLLLRKPWRFVCYILSFALALLLTTLAYTPKAYAPDESKGVCVSARVCEVPESVLDEERNILRTTLILSDVVLLDEEQEQELGKLSLTLWGESEINYGDTVRIENVKLSVPDMESANATFSPRSYYFAQGIFYQGTANPKNVSYTGHTGAAYDVVVTTRSYISDVIEQCFTNNAAVVKGMLLGNRETIAQEDTLAFRQTGVMHLFAISGFHVSIILGVFLWLMRKVKQERKGIIVAIPVLLIYCALVGFTPSIVRASLMTLIYLIVKLIGRKPDAPTAVSFSMLLILLFNPLQAFQAGFQLSYAAVLGIICLQDIFHKLFKKLWFALESVFITISAQAGTTMLSAYYFKGVPTLGILANAIIVPIFSVVLVIAFIATVLGCIFVPAGAAVGAVADLMLDAILWFLRWMVSFEWAYIDHVTTYVSTVIGCLILVFICSKYLMIRWRMKLFLCIIVIVLMFLLPQPILSGGEMHTALCEGVLRGVAYAALPAPL